MCLCVVCLLFVVCRLMRDVRCSLCVVGCGVVCCLLFCWLLFVVCWLMFVVGSVLFTDWWFGCVVACLLLAVACYLLHVSCCMLTVA